MFRELNKEHPRMSQRLGRRLVNVDLGVRCHVNSSPKASLKENGFMWIAKEKKAPYNGHELHLWEQYLRF